MNARQRTDLLRLIIDEYRVGELFVGADAGLFTELCAGNLRPSWPPAPWEFARIPPQKGCRPSRDIGMRTVGAGGEFKSFSWRNIIQPYSNRTNVLSAMRREISPQIVAHRKSATGECHHVTPFADLVTQFENKYLHGSVEHLALVKAADGLERLTDRVWAAAWQAFHRREAVLQMLSADEHRDAHARELALA